MCGRAMWKTNDRRVARSLSHFNADYTNKSIYCTFFCAFGQSPSTFFSPFVFCAVERRIRFTIGCGVSTLCCRRVLNSLPRVTLIDEIATWRWQTRKMRWKHLRCRSRWFSELGHWADCRTKKCISLSLPVSQFRNEIFRRKNEYCIIWCAQVSSTWLKEAARHEIQFPVFFSFRSQFAFTRES